MITATATAPKVTVNDDGKRKPFVFRACFIDPFQGQAAANFASRELGLKRAAVFYDKGNDYTIGLAEAFRETFEANGGEVVAWQSYSSEDTDFSAIMTNVAALKPDVLYLPDYYGRVSLIAKAAKDKGINVPMLGGDGWDSPDLDSATLAGGYFTAHYWSRTSVRPCSSSPPGSRSATASGPIPSPPWATMPPSCSWAPSSGPAAPTGKPFAALQSTQDFPAVGGQLSFDEWGNPIKSAALLQVQADGSYKYITNVD